MWPRWPLTARPGAKRCASAAPRSVSRNGSHLTQRPRSGASNSPTHSSQAGTRSHVCGANRWPPVGWGFLLNLGGVSLNTVSLCTCILMYLDVSWLSVGQIHAGYICRIHAGYMLNLSQTSKNVSSRSMSDTCGYMQ